MAPMSDPAGWEPFKPSKTRAGADAFHLSPFARMARTHMLVAMADALVTIALANSLFFDLDPNDARWKVFLYLALTMAPLALVAPFIGPALDRRVGGRRWMVVAVNAARALVCLVMIDDMSQWPAMNEVYAPYFPDHKPARSAIGADGLALGASVEIECWATVD